MTGEILTTPEFLAQLATLVQNMNANGHKKPKKTKASPEERAARIAANDAECVRVFTEAGYTDVQPRVNVLTYNRWLAVGRKVKEGEQGLAVAKFTLFHALQTEPITPADTKPS